MSAAEKADDTDSEWRCGSYRYCNTQFYSTLRGWEGKRDVAETTPDDWRVSSADTLFAGSGGAYGHDMSLNDAQGWRRSSSIWVEGTFRGGLRDYPGQDVAFDEAGNPRRQPKNSKFVAGTNLGSIYRSTKQSNVLTTARADETFLGSLRSAPKTTHAEYQRTRRSHMNLPQYRDLSSTDVSKAKRIFAQIDLDGSGSVSPEELAKFLTSLGHKSTDKAVKKLMAAAEEGSADSKLQIQEFARLYHGLSLSESS